MAEAVTLDEESSRALFSATSNIRTQWEKYKEDLLEDYHHQGQLLLPHLNLGFNGYFFNRALIANRTGSYTPPTSITQDTAYDANALRQYIDENKPSCFRTSSTHTVLFILQSTNVKELFSF